MPARFKPSLFAAALVAAALACWVPGAFAQIPGDKIKIGVLSDFSGPFADQVGKGSLVGAQLAAEDFAKEAAGLSVEIVSADHQNKPDVGVAIGRRWVDEDGVDAIVDLPNSGVGLAVNTLMHEKNRAMLASATATSDLTGKFCQPTTVQWALDTWALGSAVGRTITQMGGSTWFFISFEYALGKALQRDATEAIVKAGGSVIGSVSHPLGATDFGSYLLQAQASGAKVIALADTGTDAINAIRQAAEFQIVGPETRLAALFLQITDIDALGLEAAQGLILSEAFYWDLNDFDSRLQRALRGTHGRQDADRRPGCGLFGDIGVFARRQVGGNDRGRQGSGRNEEVADRRSSVRPRRGAGRRARDARDVCVPGQGAAAIEEPGRRLRPHRNDSAGSGLPSARPGRLPAGQVI